MTALKLIHGVQMEYPYCCVLLRGTFWAFFNDVPLPAEAPLQEELISGASSPNISKMSPLQPI